MKSAFRYTRAIRLARIVAVVTSLACKSGNDQLIVAQGRTRVLETSLSDVYLAGLQRNGGAVPTKSKVVATLDSGTTVRLLNTEYFKDRAAYKIELPDGRRGYVFPGDSILLLGSSRPVQTAHNYASGHSVYGKWLVVGFEQPGITALSPSEAKAWIGRSAFYSDSLVTFGSERCTSPTYTQATTTAHEFMALAKVYPSDLGLGDMIVSTSVGCPRLWTAPGSELFHRGSELITTWDGTYFVLHKR